MAYALELSEIAQRAGVGCRWLAGVPIALAILVAPRGSWATLVINELLPDPEGSDGGREFIELFNPGPSPESLAGVVLQFANGATQADWATRWTGATDEFLASGRRYLIVDRNWLQEPSGDSEVYLGLQNGPDAVRLARGDEVLDLVGYGPLTDPALKEGDPADIASGFSLSRRPDGRDTGDNYTDFVLTEPTPGALNFLPFSLKVAAWELDPPSVDRLSMSVRFTMDLQNNGTESFPVGEILLRIAGSDQSSLLDRLGAGQVRRISWIISPPHRGLLPLEVRVPLATGQDTLVMNPASLQAGPGNLILNEVLSVPRRGQGEWVEIAVGGESAVSLAGHSLRDEDGNWRPLPDLTIYPGEFLVLAQDSLALAVWHQENQAQGAVTDCRSELAIAAQRNLGGWPNLNNDPTAERDFADRLYLADPAGHVIDHLTLAAGGYLVGGESVPGRSLERIAPLPGNPGATNWAPCTAGTGSTPGCPNSVAGHGDTPTGFTIQPPVLDPARGTSNVHFLFTLTGEQVGWELRVFDLWGVLVRDLGGENLGPGPRDLLWDGIDDQGRPAGPGGFVVLLEVRDRFHTCLARGKRLMVIR